MIDPPADERRAFWRVGYHLDPVSLPSREISSFSHRFDDVEQRFRTLYCAELAETSLREVLADYRPNLQALKKYVETYGPAAAEDFPAETVTAAWRTENVLVRVELELDGALVDLTDLHVRQKVERRHIELLLEHGMQHLDLSEITARRRPVTQTIAADLFDRDAAAIRFPSRLDGNPCVAVFEGRGRLTQLDEPLRLTDPAPEALRRVAGPWNLELEPAMAPTRS